MDHGPWTTKILAITMCEVGQLQNLFKNEIGNGPQIMSSLTGKAIEL